MEKTILLVCAVIVVLVTVSSSTMLLASGASAGNFTTPITTSAGNTTVAPGTKMTNGTTMTMPHNGIDITIELNAIGSFAVSNLIFYSNSTDKAVHLKGLLKSILHETISGSSTIALTFRDKSTDTVLKPDVYTFIDKPVATGAIIPFDINTGYSPKNANQFPFIRALLTY